MPDRGWEKLIVKVHVAPAVSVPQKDEPKPKIDESTALSCSGMTPERCQRSALYEKSRAGWTSNQAAAHSARVPCRSCQAASSCSSWLS